MFGIQEQKQELLGLMLLYIHNHMLLNLIHSKWYFSCVVGQDGLGQTQFFEHEVGTDQVNQDGSTTTVTSFVKSFDFDLQAKQKDAQGKSSGPNYCW